MNGRQLAVVIADFSQAELVHLDFQRYLVLHGKHDLDREPRETSPLPAFKRCDPGDVTEWDPASAGSA